MAFHESSPGESNRVDDDDDDDKWWTNKQISTSGKKSDGQQANLRKIPVTLGGNRCQRIPWVYPSPGTPLPWPKSSQIMNLFFLAKNTLKGSHETYPGRKQYETVGKRHRVPECCDLLVRTAEGTCLDFAVSPPNVVTNSLSISWVWTCWTCCLIHSFIGFSRLNLGEPPNAQQRNQVGVYYPCAIMWMFQREDQWRSPDTVVRVDVLSSYLSFHEVLMDLIFIRKQVHNHLFHKMLLFPQFLLKTTRKTPPNNVDHTQHMSIPTARRILRSPHSPNAPAAIVCPQRVPHKLPRAWRRGETEGVGWLVGWLGSLRKGFQKPFRNLISPLICVFSLRYCYQLLSKKRPFYSQSRP